MSKCLCECCVQCVLFDCMSLHGLFLGQCIFLVVGYRSCVLFMQGHLIDDHFIFITLTDVFCAENFRVCSK